VTSAEPARPVLDPRLDQAISRFLDAAGWVARLLFPLGLVSLLAAVVIWLALPLQWVNDTAWRVGVVIGAGVVLVLPGVSALRVRSGLRDAVTHEETVKRDVARLLAASAREGEIRARIAGAFERLQGPNKLRAVASVGRGLLPLVKAGRETNERYESLVEAFGPAGLGELWFALLTNVVVIVGAPIAVIAGLVLFVV